MEHLLRAVSSSSRLPAFSPSYSDRKEFVTHKTPVILSILHAVDSSTYVSLKVKSLLELTQPARINSPPFGTAGTLPSFLHLAAPQSTVG